MKPRSAKAKGRRWQQWCRDQLLKWAPSLEPDDIRSTSMGAPGEDLLFSPAARKVYPISVECKNVEKLNIWNAIDQAKENSKNHRPVVMFTKNKEKEWVAIEFSYFMELVHGTKKD